mmetsp:Transcript_68346/g.146237  ORF Transcript_68346/g.146237 Transcript_68346/m.146237 type:complete len:202 (+) Transcript_68346:321-926(+)
MGSRSAGLLRRLVDGAEVRHEKRAVPCNFAEGQRALQGLLACLGLQVGRIDRRRRECGEQRRGWHCGRAGGELRCGKNCLLGLRGHLHLDVRSPLHRLGQAHEDGRLLQLLLARLLPLRLAANEGLGTESAQALTPRRDLPITKREGVRQERGREHRGCGRAGAQLRLLLDALDLRLGRPRLAGQLPGLTHEILGHGLGCG